jgi:hypothetical protein
VTFIALALLVCLLLSWRRHVGGGWTNEVADLAELAIWPLVIAGALILIL